MIRTTALFAVVFALLAAPGPLAGQMPPPTLTVGGQTATFAAPLGLFDAGTARMSVLFPRVPLAPEAEAAARASGSWEQVAGTVTPAVIADFDYTPGSTSGLVGDLKGCRLKAVGFASAWSLEGDAAHCHVVSIGGLLRPNGGIAGLLEGKGSGYSLRLPFAIALLTAPAEAAASPGAPAAPDTPLGTVRATATYKGQTVRATHGLAWWDTEEGRPVLDITLFDHAPAAESVAAAAAGRSGDEQSAMVLSLVFRGTGRDLDSLEQCSWTVDFPETGFNQIFATEQPRESCGFVSLAFPSTPKPHGAVHLRLRGDDGDDEAPFAWDLELHLPLAN